VRSARPCAVEVAPQRVLADSLHHGQLAQDFGVGLGSPAAQIFLGLRRLRKQSPAPQDFWAPHSSPALFARGVTDVSGPVSAPTCRSPTVDVVRFLVPVSLHIFGDLRLHRFGTMCLG
jgi:hypothetical protein